MTKRINYPILAAILIGMALIYVGWLGIQPVSASVAVSNEYSSTSTAPNALFGAQTASDAKLLNGPGSLGSVVITGANTGVINFWDATTTNVNLRTGQAATSTIKLLASIPASTVAGTYTFDVFVSTGLVYDVYAGIMPTTTITYRVN